MNAEDRGVARGRVLYVPEQLLVDTWRALAPTARLRVECGVRWAGPAGGGPDAHVATTALLPRQRCSAGFFQVIGGAPRPGAVLQQLGLVVVAQLHTHPDQMVRHSEWDDDHAYSTREGALSIVWPQYGLHLPPVSSWGVHELRLGEWVLLGDEEASARVVVLPGVVDLRLQIQVGRWGGP